LKPDTSAKEISEGYGVGYIPISASVAAANKSTLRNSVNKNKTDYGGDVARRVIEEFNTLIKKKVDQQDMDASEDLKSHNEVLEKCTPYIR